MGPIFSSRRVRLALALIMLDVVVMGCLVFPVFPVSSSAVMFELKSHTLKGEKFVYRWFKMEGGDKVRVDFWCDKDVDTYIFSESQFTSFATDGTLDSMASMNLMDKGKLVTGISSPGTYFFVVDNPHEEPAEVVFAQATGSLTERITLAQSLKEYWFGDMLNDIVPFSRMVRDEAGVGSFA
jgi:hypothetical protein